MEIVQMKMITLTCANSKCGKIFERSEHANSSSAKLAARKNRPHRPCCSTACSRALAWEENANVARIELTCSNPECGKIFTVTESRKRYMDSEGSQNSYCSRKCSHAAQRAAGAKSQMITLVCSNCGRSFERSKRYHQNSVWRAEKLGIPLRICCSRTCGVKMGSKENAASRRVKLVCANQTCGQEFTRRRSQHERNAAEGVAEYCCVACRNEAKKSNSTREGRITFRQMLSCRRSTEMRRKDREIEIDEAYLEQLWEEQGHRCAITGIELELIRVPKDKGHLQANFFRRLHQASIDRIDSFKGYIPGNVQFVSTPVNVAKSNMSRSEFVQLCRLVVAEADRAARPAAETII